MLDKILKYREIIKAILRLIGVLGKKKQGADDEKTPTKPE